MMQEEAVNTATIAIPEKLVAVARTNNIPAEELAAASEQLANVIKRSHDKGIVDESKFLEELGAAANAEFDGVAAMLFNAAFDDDDLLAGIGNMYKGYAMDPSRGASQASVNMLILAIDTLNARRDAAMTRKANEAVDQTAKPAEQRDTPVEVDLGLDAKTLTADPAKGSEADLATGNNWAEQVNHGHLGRSRGPKQI